MHVAAAQAAPHPPGPTARIASPGAGTGRRVTSVITEMEKTLGQHPTKKRLFELIAKKYPHYPVIDHALSEYRADKPAKHHPLKFFQTILHRKAHRHGYEWIRPCGSECMLRHTP